MLLTKSLVIYRNIKVKNLFFLLILFFIPCKTFSQNVRTGIYGVSQFPLGNASEYFLNASGGGLGAEFGFSDKFGESVRIQYSTVIPKNEIIKSSWQFTFLIGIWYGVSIGETGFSFQPCIDAGIMYLGSTTKEGYGKLSQRAYPTFIFQVCPSFRFKHEKFLARRLEIELSPVWSLVPQQTGGISFIGARLGLMYFIDL